MWIASKALWLVIQPLSWLFFSGLIAALFAAISWRRVAIVFALFTPLFLVVISVTPLPLWMIHSLEKQHRAPADGLVPSDTAGVIVLGGTTQLFDSGSAVPPMTAASERFLQGLVIARQLPADRALVFTGASRSFSQTVMVVN